jgi:hypothetical protein
MEIGTLYSVLYLPDLYLIDENLYCSDEISLIFPKNAPFPGALGGFGVPTRKEMLLRVLKKGIMVSRSDEGDAPSCEVWTFDDRIMTREMKKMLSEEWTEDQSRLCQWLAPVFGRIAYEVENGGYPDDLAGLDLDLLEEHLDYEVEADILMLREVEKAYRIAFRFVRWFLDETPAD